jgi:hypothetical protein
MIRGRDTAAGDAPSTSRVRPLMSLAPAVIGRARRVFLALRVATASHV